jgi:rhodanese-related sulfurtransferase
MNVRLLLAGVIVAALAVAAYQAAQLARDPSPSEAAPAPAAPPAKTAPEPAAPSAPDSAEAGPSEASASGADAPFDRDVARRITVDEVKRLLDRGEKIAFVDTRAHVPDVIIKGAAQVPEDELEAWARRVPRDAFVVVYCTCANESTAAREVLALQRLGFRRAFALRDGLMAWQSLDLPTEPPRRERPAA